MAVKGDVWLGDWVNYFAYGSNMNPERMWYRVPGARAVGVGALPGWRVVERLYADIQRDPRAVTEGVIYRMRVFDLQRLDHFEGAPNVYERKWVKVHVGGMVVEALTYVMTPKTRKERNGRKYPEEYRAVCSVGARSFGLTDVFGKEAA